MHQITPYLILVAGWGMYFFLHSLLASPALRLTFQNKREMPGAFYRLSYSIISIIGLLALLFYNGTIQSERLIPLSDLIKYISFFLAGIGVIILNASFKKYNLKSFLGFKEDNETVLHTDGILSYVRHPIYLTIVLIVIGFFLYDSRMSTLVSMVCIFLYLPIGIYFEEKKLIEKYGDKYRKYRKGVSAIFPSLKSFKSLL